MPLMQKIFSKIPIVISNTSGLSLQFTLILETISQAQLIHLVIATSFSRYHGQNKNFDLFEILTSFTSVLGTFGCFENFASRTLVYAALSVFAAYFLFQILLFVGMTTQIIKNININPRFAQIIANFSIIHSRLFFFLMLYFSLGLLNHNNVFGEDSLTMKGQRNIGSSVVALVLSLCNIGFAIIQEFFFYRINKNKNAYGTKNNHMHKIVLFHKLLGLIVHFFFQNSPLKVQVTSIAHLLLIVSSMYILYTKLPFYNTKVLKTVVLLTASNFSFAVISIIKAFDQELDISESGLLISCFVIVKFHWNYFNKVLERTLEGRMDTPEKAIHFVILMKENNLGSPNFPIFKRKFNSASIFANGYMRKEGIETIQITDTKSAKEYKREAYTHFIKKLTFLLERNPESDVLILFTANLYLKKLGNVFMAANLLEKLKQRNSSIPVKNSVENMEIHLKNVCHRIYANSDYNLELSTYFEFKTKTEAMRKSVDLETSKHIALWQELGSKRPSILKIINISASIDQIELKTLPKFKEYSQGPSSKFAPFLLLHANYLQIIKELPHEAIKVFKKIQTQAIIQTETHIFDVNSDEAGVFVFSLNKGRVGTILNVSASTSNLFHFQKSRLVGASLHLLLPKVVADKYIQILENSLREPTCLLKNFKTYAKAKEKEYFEVEIQFQMYPHHFYGLCLLAIFKKVSSEKLIIITDDRNIIQECSKELQETFHFESSANKIHYRLEDILPEFGPATYLLNRAVSNSDHFSHRSSINGHQGIADFIKSCSLFKPSAPEPKTQLDDSINSLTQIKPHNEEVPFVRRRNRTRSHFLTVISSAGIENQTLADLYFSNRSERSNSPDEDDQALARPIKLKFYPLQDKGFPIEYGVRVKKFQFEERVFKIIVLTPLNDDIPKNREQNSPDFGSKPTKNLHDSFADSFPEDEERPDISPSRYEGRQNIEKLDIDPSNRDKIKLSSSHSIRNLSNQFQNILDNKREKGYLPTILNRLDQTEDRSSRGFYMQRVIRSIKTLKSVFSNKESHPLPRLSILFLYFIMICLVLLAGINLFLSRDSFHQTSHGLQIVNVANQRLALTVDVWAQLLKILARTTDTVPNYLVVREYQETVYTDTIQLIETNNNLYEFFETSSQRTFLDNAFNQDIRFWEIVDNQSKNVFEGNTFAATNMLLNKYLTIGNYSDVLDFVSTQDYLSLLNNTANDYLLSSEGIIETTENLLDEILGKKQDNLKLVLASINSGLALMLCIVLALSWMIVQSYKRLFCTLAKIPEKHISQRIEQLEHVRSALKWDINTKEFANNQVQLLNKNTERVKLAQITGISENNFEETYWIEQTSKYVARYIGITVFCLLLVSGMFLIALIKTQREFNTLEDVNNQLTVMADGVYQTNMVFGNFYFNVLLQDKPNVYIRNSSPDDQLSYSLSMVNQLNQRLLTAFTTNSYGNDDPVIESILKNNICDLIAMPEQLNRYCENATKGNTLGLLALVSDYYDVSLQYISLYRQNQTLSYAKSLLGPYNAAMNTTLPVLQYASQFLISYVLSDLDAKVEEFVQQEVLQFGILISVIAVCTVLTRVIVLKKLMFLDIGKRRILKNVPYYAIQENRFLKFYLVREYNKELVAIKNIL